MVIFALLAALVSVPNAAVWIFYIRSVQHKKPLQAAMWDGAIVLFSNFSILTLWHESGNSPSVLLTYLVGGMVGSYVTIRLTTDSRPLPYFQQQTDYTCGPAALRSVLASIGIRASEEELAARAWCTPEDGTLPRGMVAAAQSYGLAVTAYHGWTLGELESHVPVIVCIQAQGEPEEYDRDESGHYVVVTGMSDGAVHYLDPSEGQASLPVKEFEGRWHDRETDGSATVRWGMTVYAR